MKLVFYIAPFSKESEGIEQIHLFVRCTVLTNAIGIGMRDESWCRKEKEAFTPHLTVKKREEIINEVTSFLSSFWTGFLMYSFPVPDTPDYLAITEQGPIGRSKLLYRGRPRLTPKEKRMKRLSFGLLVTYIFLLREGMGKTSSLLPSHRYQQREKKKRKRVRCEK